MSNRSKAARNRIALGGVAIGIATHVYFTFFYPSPFENEAAGTIGSVKKSRSEQITNNDVQIAGADATDAAAQRFAQLSASDKATLANRMSVEERAAVLSGASADQQAALYATASVSARAAGWERLSVADRAQIMAAMAVSLRTLAQSSSDRDSGERA